MERRKARLILAWLWILGGLVIAGLLFVQTIWTGMYEGSEREVWSLVSSSIVPQAALMLGVLGAEAFETGRKEEDVLTRRGVFLLVIVISAAFLLAVLAVVVAVPITFSRAPLTRAAVPLEILQGLVAASLGIFFVSEAPRSSPATAPSRPV